MFWHEDLPHIKTEEKLRHNLPIPIVTSVSSVRLQMKSSSCRMSELLIASIIMSVICMFSISPPSGLLAPLLPTDRSHDPLLGLPKFVSLADWINSSYDASLVLSSGDLEYWWSVSQMRTEVCFGSSKLTTSMGVSTVRVSQLVWAPMSPCSGRNSSFRRPIPKMSGRSRSLYKLKILTINK